MYPPGVEDWTECAQTHSDRQYVFYPPVSLRSLGGYNIKSAF